MGWIRKSLAVSAVAVCGLLATGGPAGAGGPSDDIDLDPDLECVFPLDGGGYVALFGYENDSRSPATVPIGNSNRVTPGAADRGQPTTFAPGRVVGAFTAESDGAAIVWHLTNRSATANKNSKKCAEPPVPVGTGGTQSFVWLAVAAGAIVIVGGGSGTAWFMRKRRSV
jgi:hypothetical protein